MAGAAKIDITPINGQQITMSGFSSRTGPFTGIHDNLFVRSVVVYDGEDYAVYVSADQLRVESSDFKMITDTLAAEGINIPVENYMVAATHTHGAPSTGANANSDTTAYQDQRLTSTIDAIRDAYNNLTDVTIRVGKTDVLGFSNNRQEQKVGPLGTVTCQLGQDVNGISDKQVNFAEFITNDGTSLATIVLVGVHSTVMGEHNSFITGDFAGATATHIEGMRASDHVSLWMMSGGGDQSPTYYHQPTSFFQDTIRSPEGQTRALSDIILTSLSGAQEITEIDIVADVELVDLPLKSGGTQTRAIYAISWTEDIVFLATPFELFSETAINLRNNSDFEHTFIQSKTNGSAFYLPTESSAGLGCYENNLALFPESAEPIFADAASRLIEAMHTSAAN